MTARVKICGITTEAGMDAASPRHVTPRRAAELAARPGLPTLVGLFVKPEDPEIAAVLAAVKLDVLQVYVDAPRAAEIRTRFGLPVWRAVGVSAATDLPRDPGGVDGFVIEAKAPPGATRPGGNAVTFDWSILAGWHAPAPWLLAGGLGPDNVAEAIRATGATAVDVASGVEHEKGIKDPALVAAFARAARTAVGAT